MSFKKKISLLILAAIALINITLLSYIFQNKNISLENTSKFYSINYKATTQYAKLLNQWGIWKKNGVLIYPDTNLKTIKKITIRVMDLSSSKTGGYQFYHGGYAQKAELSNDGNLFILIYLYKNLTKSNPTEKLDRTLLFAVSEVLYTMTHYNIKDAEDQTRNIKVLKADLESLSDNQLPFTIQQIK